MDVHRCRFVPFPASPITAIAFSHPLVDSKRPVRLAIGRANGDIEIWNPLSGSWFQETIIHGGVDRSIDALVWVTADDETLPDGSVILGKLRLFSIGCTATVTEWDLEKGKARRHASGQHGDLWCLGAQPAASRAETNGVAAAAQPQRLVAGTIDGSILLYSIDDDDLQFQRALVKTPKRDIKMVCITFQSRQVAVVGCSDSSIRVYSLKRGQLLRKMTLGKDLIGGSEDIIVWSVKCLKNGDIVSGDSTGQIVIWDGKTYTQAQRIQGHEQDVLSLATSVDGRSIMSGGMDRRTALYRPMPRDSSRWQRVWHRKHHDHDVRAMASFEGQGMSVVVTGGPDATPVVIPLRQAGVENHRTLSHLPHAVPMQSASDARYIISWWEREVHVWTLRRSKKDLEDSSEQNIDKNRKRLARIYLKGEANITSASISKDGLLLVVATTLAIMAFHLIPAKGSKEELQIRKIQLPTAVETAGSTLVQISPNCQWLAWVQDGIKVRTARITRDGSSDEAQITIHPRPAKLTRLRRDIRKQVRLGGLGSYNRRITHLAFSPGSDILATADLAGYVDTWVLQDASMQNGASPGEDDDASSSISSDSDSDNAQDPDSGPRWTRNPKAPLFPKLSQSPVVLSFSEQALGPPRPGGGGAPDPPVLLAVTSASRIYAFHPLEGSLTRWSRRNGDLKMPDVIRATRDIIKGVLWHGSRIWLYGASFLFMLDITQDYTKEADVSTKQKKSRKRKRGPDTGAGSKMDQGEALAPQHVRVALAEHGKGGEWVDVAMAHADASHHGTGQENSDESENDEDGELQKLRDREQSAQKKGAEATKEGSTRKSWWHTYKYRPILGIMPLSTVAEAQTNGVNGHGHGGKGKKAAGDLPTLEVALVERPKWDLDLPARYVED